MQNLGIRLNRVQKKINFPTINTSFTIERESTKDGGESYWSWNWKRTKEPIKSCWRRRRRRGTEHLPNARVHSRDMPSGELHQSIRSIQYKIYYICRLKDLLTRVSSSCEWVRRKSGWNTLAKTYGAGSFKFQWVLMLECTRMYMWVAPNISASNTTAADMGTNVCTESVRSTSRHEAFLSHIYEAANVNVYIYRIFLRWIEFFMEKIWENKSLKFRL